MTGLNVNRFSYTSLTMMIAQVCDLETAEFVHTLGDASIFCNYFEQVATQLALAPTALPVIKINPDVKDLFAFTFDDFCVGRVRSCARLCALPGHFTRPLR